MQNPTHRVGSFARTSLLFFLILLEVDLRAEDVAPVTVTAAPKSHVLFMGTDISIERGKKLYRIQDVLGTSFIISVDGEKTFVPMRGEPHNMKLEQSLKLTTASASLTGLTAERAYTPRSDPKMKRMLEASRAANAIGDNASLAEGKYLAALNPSVAINGEPGAQGGPGGAVNGAAVSAAALGAIGAGAAREAFAAKQMADAMFNTEFTNAGFAQIRAEADLAQELFDAVEVNFELSSPTELTSPYLVLVVRYHPKTDKPGTSRDLIYARALNAIGSKPEKIHILQGGFPRGYELESYQVHLYNLGQEVATDVAPKRVALTRDEAFEYVKAEYLGTHKGATLPSRPAMGKLGLETKAQLTPAQLSGVYFVKVTKEGKPVEAFTDEACSQPVDGTIDSLVKSVRFFPALEAGKRVEGVARLTFSHLTR